MVFHWRLHIPQEECFNVSHLCYASIEQPQYEATVKLPGSFRLTAGTRHLYRDCIFTEQVLETVSQSLRHSCTSELTRQGNTLYFSFFTAPALVGACTIGLYLHLSYLSKRRCLAFGLLLARFGLYVYFYTQGSYGSGLFNPTIVPVRSAQNQRFCAEP